MWQFFFKKRHLREKNSKDQGSTLLGAIADLNDMLIGHLKPSLQSSQMEAYGKAYFEASPESIIDFLPELYLKFEEYLTEIAAEPKLLKQDLRIKVEEKFPLLLEQEHFGFIFQDEVAKEVYLGKIFLEGLLDEIIQLFGRAKEALFLAYRDWVSKLPERYHFPLVGLTTNDNEKTEVLLRIMAHHICGLVEKKMGTHFTRKILDRQYELIAKKYKYLNAFPFVISLIPRPFLDSDKLGLLSNHQLTSTLLHQVKHLEDLNTTLAEGNETLKKTKDELKKAKLDAELALEALENRTQQLEATQKAQEALLAELKKSNEELEQFAFVASHDLQEPLRTIDGYIKLIIQEVELEQNGRLSEFISHTISGVNRMQELIRSLLEFSKAGEVNEKEQDIDLDVLIEVVEYNLRQIISERKAEITASFPCQITADRTRLIQLFQNLISNAIKFCGKEIKPHIQIKLEDRKEDWLFAVQDNGIGIQAEDQSSVFALFKRGNPNPSHTGNGIGLAICKKIVEQHQGEIWVESTPGNGSTFYFTIKKPTLRKPHPQ